MKVCVSSRGRRAFLVEGEGEGTRRRSCRPPARGRPASRLWRFPPPAPAGCRWEAAAVSLRIRARARLLRRQPACRCRTCSMRRTRAGDDRIIRRRQAADRRVDRAFWRRHSAAPGFGVICGVAGLTVWVPPVWVTVCAWTGGGRKSRRAPYCPGCSPCSRRYANCFCAMAKPPLPRVKTNLPWQGRCTSESRRRRVGRRCPALEPRPSALPALPPVTLRPCRRSASCPGGSRSRLEVAVPPLPAKVPTLPPLPPAPPTRGLRQADRAVGAGADDLVGERDVHAVACGVAGLGGGAAGAGEAERDGATIARADDPDC